MSDKISCLNPLSKKYLTEVLSPLKLKLKSSSRSCCEEMRIRAGCRSGQTVNL